MRKLLAICLLTTTGTSCGSESGPTLPVSAQRFDAPPVYTAWWSMVEQCSGISGSLQEVSWFRVPGVWFVTVPIGGTQQSTTGYWSSAGNRVVLPGERVFEGETVRHEMLHALLRIAGHPREAFLRKCAGVVACGTRCTADSDPPAAPDPAAPRVGSGELEVDYALSPAQPAAGVNGGWFSLTVTARNPATHPIVVELSPPSTSAQGRTFRYDIQQGAARMAAGVHGLDPEAVQFNAGETKRQVFDFRVDAQPAGVFFGPGVYAVSGGYDVTFTEFRQVTLGP